MKGTLVVYRPIGDHVQYIREITLTDLRATVIEEGSYDVHSFPAAWCHVLWYGKVPAQCQAFDACLNNAERPSAYCEKHKDCE